MKNMHLNNLLKGFLVSVTILALGASVHAQTRYDSNLKKLDRPIPKEYKEDIIINTTIMLNDDHVELSNVMVTIFNKTTGKEFCTISSNYFKIFLKHDCEYVLSFEYPGYARKSVIVNTYAPTTFRWVVDLTMRLYDNESPGTVGILYYDKQIDNFTSKGYLKPY